MSDSDLWMPIVMVAIVLVALGVLVGTWLPRPRDLPTPPFAACEATARWMEGAWKMETMRCEGKP